MTRRKPKLIVVEEITNIVPAEVLDRLRAERALKEARAGTLLESKTAS